MKKLLICALALPFLGMMRVRHAGTDWTNVAEVRSGQWPINLQRDGATYYLIFRDQQVLNAESLDTLPFPNLGQLQYLGKALTALKAGNNGDEAQFKDYTLKRADKKGDGIWYILRYQEGLTDFRQSEADIMCKTIKGL